MKPFLRNGGVVDIWHSPYHLKSHRPIFVHSQSEERPRVKKKQDLKESLKKDVTEERNSVRLDAFEYSFFFSNFRRYKKRVPANFERNKTICCWFRVYLFLRSETPPVAP
jgi:hypothetical protein